MTGQFPRSPDASMSVKRLESGAGADHSGAALVTGQLPLSPRCFGCWRSLRSCGRRRPVYPQGKGREIPGGNQRRRSAAGTFPAPQAPTKEGLDRSERTRTIRQDSSKNRKSASTARAKRGPCSRPGRLLGEAGTQGLQAARRSGLRCGALACSTGLLLA